MSTKISIRDNAIHLSQSRPMRSYKQPSNVYTYGVARGENFEKDFDGFMRQTDFLRLNSSSSLSFIRTGECTGTVSSTMSLELDGIKMQDVRVVWVININQLSWTMQYRVSITAPNTSLSKYRTRIILRRCGELYTAKTGVLNQRIRLLIRGVLARTKRQSSLL